MRDLFSSTAAAWSPRPTDPGDAFFAQLVASDPPGAGEPSGGVALFGVPFDGAVLGRRGARGGPDVIRADLARMKPWTLRGGPVPLCVRDWGNVVVPADDVLAAHEVTEAAARAVLAQGAFPLVLGGDHSLTFPLVKAHEGRLRSVGVINLDAHLDVRDVHGVPNSGTSFGRLLASGLVPGRNLVEVGLRDFANSDHYARKARAAGATLLGAAEWRETGLVAIERAIEIARDGVDGVYLSVDVDVLDQAHAPGVSAPTPGGMTSAELLAAVRLVAERAPLVGADVMEVAPNLDRDGVTSRAAAACVMSLLAGLPAR